MFNFGPTISDDHLFIVGFAGAGGRCNSAYKIPVANITASLNQQHNSGSSSKWTEMTAADHFYTAVVPRSSSVVVVGGQYHGIPTADVKMYDTFNKSWKKIGSLSSARSHVTVAAVYDNAILIIGGCTKGENHSPADLLARL